MTSVLAGCRGCARRAASAARAPPLANQPRTITAPSASVSSQLTRAATASVPPWCTGQVPLPAAMARETARAMATTAGRSTAGSV